MKRLSFGSWPFLHGAYRDEPVGFHKLLHRLQDSGYDGVELGACRPHPNPDTHDTVDRCSHVRVEVAEHGLAFSGMAPNLRGHSLVSTDSHELYLSAFTRFADFAAAIGTPTIRVDTVEPLVHLAAIPVAVMIDRATRAFAECSRLAADRGMRVAWEFEPHLPLHSAEQILAVTQGVRSLGYTNFGIMFDVAHAHVSSNGNEHELLRQFSRYINHVHLCDTDGTQDECGISRHLPFGQGCIDFQRLLPDVTGLIDVEWWTIDMCYQDDAWTTIGSAKRFLEPFRK
jgi:sugar phosphate isomerase/epimerase